MYRNVLLLSLCFLSLMSVSFAATCGTSASFTASINPGSRTQLTITYPRTLGVTINKYLTTESNINAKATICSNEEKDSMVSLISTSLDNGINSVLLTAVQASAGVSPSAGARVAPSIAPLSLIALCAMFLFPKNRLSILVLFGVIGVGMYAHAASTITLTFDVEIPSSITQICINGECESWPQAGAPTLAPGTNAPVPGQQSTIPGSTTTPGSPTLAPALAEFDLRVLILTFPPSIFGEGPGVYAQLMCNSVGMQYDVVYNGTSLTSYLSTSGVGKYSAIVVANEVNTWTGDILQPFLSSSDQALVTAYQQKYSAKVLVLASKPNGLPGLQAAADNMITPGNNTQGFITLASGAQKYATMLRSGLRLNTTKSAVFANYPPARVYSATITDSSKATAVLNYESGSTTNVAAAIITRAAGTQELHVFAQEQEKYQHSLACLSLFQNYISPAGIYIGKRRLSLAVQPDDLFSATNLWDVKKHKNPQSDKLTYRMTIYDMQQTADYVIRKNQELQSVAPGSYVTIEWPYNGAPTVLEGPAPKALKQKTIELADNFYFVSHTYEHPCDFNTANYSSIYYQLNENVKWAETQFLPNGLANSRVSNNSLVNPCISGMFNPNMWNAFGDNGLVYAVGDNSVPALRPSNPYHGNWTTTAVQGYVGGFIIPRECNDIYYDCTLPEEMMDEWASHPNRSAETKNWSFEQVMDQNNNLALYNFLTFRQDPYMFHQANFRWFPYDDPVTGTTHNTTLTILWMDRLIDSVMSFYNLPIYSPIFHDMGKMWSDRLALDACTPQVRLKVDANNKIFAIDTESIGHCDIQLSGLTLPTSSTVRMETYGSEKTAYVTSTGAKQTFVLSSPLSI